MKQILLLAALLLCLCGCGSQEPTETPAPAPSELPPTPTPTVYDFETDGWETVRVQPCGHGYLNVTDMYQERVVDCTCPDGQEGDTDTEHRIACNGTGETTEQPRVHNE